jgi:hypothetical protein
MYDISLDFSQKEDFPQSVLHMVDLLYILGQFNSSTALFYGEFPPG